jgi:acyl-CoA synthetase (AMP-forming)/AMP-acid ligase II
MMSRKDKAGMNEGMARSSSGKQSRSKERAPAGLGREGWRMRLGVACLAAAPALGGQHVLAQEASPPSSEQEIQESRQEPQETSPTDDAAVTGTQKETDSQMLRVRHYLNDTYDQSLELFATASHAKFETDMQPQVWIPANGGDAYWKKKNWSVGAELDNQVISLGYKAAFFYRSGDLVRRDGNGNLIVEGRIKEQINRCGEKISAAEVEEALSALRGVHTAVAVGVPDALLGERICAFIKLEGKAIDPVAVKAALRERGLSDYKVPDQIETIAEWPLTAAGKIDKRCLLTIATQRTSGEPMTSTGSYLHASTD